MNGVIINPSVFGKYCDDTIQKIIMDFKNSNELSSGYFPEVDVIQKDNSINFIAELPGINKEDVKIVLEDGVLSISGEKKINVDEKDDVKIYRNERKFGKFERRFKLQEDIDPDNINAKFENGVLTVSVELLIPEPPKEKVIEIK